MATRVKIVPMADPNADGRWITVEVNIPAGTRWNAACDLVAGFIPADHFVCAFDSPTTPLRQKPWGTLE